MPGPCAPYLDRPGFSDLCDCYDDGTATQPQKDLADDALQAATEMIWILTGRTFNGVCTVRAYPCSETCASWMCACLPDGGLRLHAPVLEATVYVADTAVPPEEVLLIDERILYRLDLATGNFTPWPRCSNNLARASFWVDYTYGEAPNKLWELATSEVACDLFKSLDPTLDSSGCLLPPGVVAASTQGLSMSIEQAAKGLDEDQTAFPFLNRLMSVYNPTGQAMASYVNSPDADPTLHSRSTPTPLP